jgi:Rho-binding antiterminator
MSDESDYQPIECGLYSEYEVAIMQRRRWRMHWRDEAGNDHLETLRPTDLQTRQGQEFMLAVTDGGAERCIRLDRIIRIENLAGEK